MNLSRANLKRLAAGHLPLPTEDEIQKTIVDGLVAYGYLVLVTTRRAKKCPHCKKYSHQGDGASKGIADLQVRKQTWPKGIWMSLEVKKPGPVEYSSKEQELLAIAGDIVVCQSLEDALRALEGFKL